MSSEKMQMAEAEPVRDTNFDRRPSKMDFNHLEKVPTNTPEWNDLRDDAMRAEENEKSMGLVEGLRNYPNAVLWSLAISLCISELSLTAGRSMNEPCLHAAGVAGK